MLEWVAVSLLCLAVLKCSNSSHCQKHRPNCPMLRAHKAAEDGYRMPDTWHLVGLAAAVLTF